MRRRCTWTPGQHRLSYERAGCVCAYCRVERTLKRKIYNNFVNSKCCSSVFFFQEKNPSINRNVKMRDHSVIAVNLIAVRSCPLHNSDVLTQVSSYLINRTCRVKQGKSTPHPRWTIKGKNRQNSSKQPNELGITGPCSTSTFFWG